MNESTSPIAIQAKIKDGIQIVEISGRLLYQNIPAAKEQLNACWLDVPSHILDCSKMERIDSTGFGLLFNLLRRIPTGGKLAAVVVDPFIQELFSITKVHLLMTVVNSLPDAVKAVNMD